MSYILVTGGAGFIGSHVVKRLLEHGQKIVLVDNFNSFYSPALKHDRIRIFIGEKWIRAKKLIVIHKNLSLCQPIRALFKTYPISSICHLAAQPGVRFYNTHTDAYRIYRTCNIDSFLVLCELAREFHIQHVVYASTASVYGKTTHFPFTEKQNTDLPLSLYAATKKSMETIAHAYHAMCGIPFTGLRFFNVYGPWGRPDGAYYRWAQSISKGKPIDIYGYGKQQRDWTYIDDIVEGVIRIMQKPQTYNIYNIGRGKAEHLMDFLRYIEFYLGKTAHKRFLPLQTGEVSRTWCDTRSLKRDFGYRPHTTVKDGIKKFIEWFKTYHQ